MPEDTLVRDNEDIRLLRGGKAEEFNQKAETEAESIDLKNANLRLADLRGLDLHRVDLSGAYLRNADMRGVDLSQANLSNAQLDSARLETAARPSLGPILPLPGVPPAG